MSNFSTVILYMRLLMERPPSCRAGVLNCHWSWELSRPHRAQLKEEVWVLLHKGQPVSETSRVGLKVSWLGSKGEDIPATLGAPEDSPARAAQMLTTSGTLVGNTWGVLVGVAMLLFVLVMPEN